MNKSSLKYRNFEELKKNEKEGVDFIIKKVSRLSPVLIMAPHGGRIEFETSEIAEALAENKYSFYSFQGIKSKNNWSLHISSNNYQENRALMMIEKSKLIISIHGYREIKKLIILGGKNKTLRSLVSKKLRSSGFKQKK